MPLPLITQEQRLLGLARANEARRHRAALKRALTARQATLADVLDLRDHR